MHEHRSPFHDVLVWASGGLAAITQLPVGTLIQAMAATGAFCGGIAALGNLWRTLRLDRQARAAKAAETIARPLAYGTTATPWGLLSIGRHAARSFPLGDAVLESLDAQDATPPKPSKPPVKVEELPSR